jgi:hypothetical protein
MQAVTRLAHLYNNPGTGSTLFGTPVALVSKCRGSVLFDTPDAMDCPQDDDALER